MAAFLAPSLAYVLCYFEFIETVRATLRPSYAQSCNCLHNHAVVGDSLPQESPAEKPLKPPFLAFRGFFLG